MRHRYLLVLPALSACQSTAPPASPAACFAALEQRLLAADHVEVEFEITAEGVHGADLRGLLLVHHGLVYVVAQGTFAGRPTRVEMVSTDSELRGGVDVAHVLGPRPPALEEGILLGLTRMGLLHNLAVLSQNQGPDGVDGAMRSWVQVEQVEQVEPGADGSLRFDLVVAGQRTGRASLQLALGLPAAREQVVQFPTGEMRVVERYRRFEVRDPREAATIRP